MKKIIICIALAVSSATAFAQVGVGTSNPDASAILDVTSTTKGFLPPRMTTAQRNAISSPAAGLMIYNTDQKCLNVFVISIWRNLCATDGVSASGTITHNSVSYEAVNSPATGAVWLDRNLGASRVATSSTDIEAYGDLYQWGRATDGHQLRTSGATTTNATTAVPNAGNAWDGLFIVENSDPFDWLTTPDATLWQGVNGTNNPCPTGYRIPTSAELNAEKVTWASNNSAGAFASPLKLTLNGGRYIITGVFLDVGTIGYYWSSTISGGESLSLSVLTDNSLMDATSRGWGLSVRCIKD